MGVTRSAPFAIFGIALAVGIWLASQFALPPWSLLIALALTIVCAVAIATGITRVHAQRDAVWLTVFLVLIALGALRYSLAQAPNELARRIAGQRVILDGIIIAEPDVREAHVNLRVRPVRVAERSTIDVSDDISRSVVLVRAPIGEGDDAITWHYGDAIRADGNIGLPPRMAAFDYRDYLARRGVQLWMPKPARVWRTGEGQGDVFFTRLLDAKDAVRKTIVRMMPMPESALLNGVLIGDDNAIPDTLNNAFRRTGTSHIVAISGFNVSIVVGIVVWLLSRLVNPRPAALIALPAIALYTIFVGATPSVLRAAFMASIGLFGLLLWRRGAVLNTLCAAAVIMLLGEPNVLFDVGFQLSFMATLGLVLYADRISEPVHAWVEARVANQRARRVIALVLDGVLMTTAAQITTLPLIVVTYDQLSLVSLLTNAVVLPLQPPLMVLGAAVAALGLILPMPATQLLAWLPYIFLTLTIRAVEWMGAWPFASVRVGWFGTAAAVVYYLALTAVTLFIALPATSRALMTRQVRQRAWATGLSFTCISVLAAGALFWWQRPDGKLHVTLRGGSALVELPSGKQLLFMNGGTVLPMLETGLPVWDRQIDWLILPRADEQTFNDAQIIVEHYRADVVLVPQQFKAGVVLSNTAQVSVPPTDAVTLDERVTMRAIRGAQSLAGVEIAYGSASIALVASCLGGWSTVTRVDVMLADPRTCTAERIAAFNPRWVIWADVDGRLPADAAQRPSYRSVSLMQIEQVSFVSDGRQLVPK